MFSSTRVDGTQVRSSSTLFGASRLVSFVVISATTLAFAGCSSKSDGPEIFTSSGTVLYNGEPVADGRIVFRSLDGDGRGFSAPIKDGEYSIETYGGRMRVEVRASREVPGKFDHSNGEPTPVGEMYIPARYNSQSDLVTNVPADADVEFALAG